MVRPLHSVSPLTVTEITRSESNRAQSSRGITPMAKQQKRLGELLVEWGAVSLKDVNRALEHAKKQNQRIGEALIELKLVSDAAVYKALASQHNMEYVDLDKNSISPNIITAIPDDLMRKYLILPLGKEHGRSRVVVHDPLD